MMSSSAVALRRIFSGLAPASDSGAQIFTAKAQQFIDQRAAIAGHQRRAPARSNE